jgi:DNA replication protein DnaC
VSIPGKSSRLARCECRTTGRPQRLLQKARIPARYEHCTLEDYDTEFPGAHRSLAQARLAAGRIVDEYPIEKSGLLLTGPAGTGKTHLAVGIIRALALEKGIECLFCDYRELLRQIINSYQPSVEATELDILQPIFDTEVLLLDELGAVNVTRTEWVWETVSYILNHRYNEKKTTIITTNFPDLPSRQALADERIKQQELRISEEQTRAALVAGREKTLGDRITDRMRSRIHDMCRVVELYGTDFRMAAKNVTQRIRSSIPTQETLDELRRLRQAKKESRH